MVHRAWIKGLGLVVLVGLLSWVAGCGPSHKERARVKGTVSIGSKKLNSGTVEFRTKDNRSGSAPIDAEGNYDMPDAPVGEVTILVTVSAPSKMMMSMGAGNRPKPATPTGTGADKMGGPKMIDPAKAVRVPEKYGKAETSGLTYTVTKGEQTKDINLTE
jgi:hypothetical protein